MNRKTAHTGNGFRALAAYCLLCAFAAVVCCEEGEKPDLTKLAPAVTGKVDFQGQVEPLLLRCVRCHGAEKAKAGLRLHRREDLLAGGDNGAVVISGDSAGSRLVHAVAALGKLVMPPGKKDKRLTAAEIGVLRGWIDQGLSWPGDRQLGGKGTSSAGLWAFRPVKKTAPPVVEGDSWSRNPIDRFILSRMKMEGLAPSPEADRYTLIRRLSLDLTGLLPKPEQVRRFVEDKSAKAWENLVRRMLRSPHFGERWGRYWLDLARYADSDGYEKDGVRPFAWRYRDWVIDAFNRDLSFDRFTREQLAGDLLEDSGIEQKVATGFHRNTLSSTEGGTDQEEFRIKAVVDRLNTTGSVWLGLTVGCAQCHTHKYDPITQREYYSLFAFFNSCDEKKITAPLPVDLASYKEQETAHRKILTELEKPLREYETKKLGELLADGPGRLATPGWKILKPSSAAASSGASMETLGDGSVLLGGKVPDKDTYTLEFEPGLDEVMALRLEVLTHKSLPKKGPGRADNGNFVLSELELSVLGGDGKEPGKAAFRRAAADHSQNDFDIQKAIDGSREGKAAKGWAIAGPNPLNQDRAAVFILSASLELPRGSKLSLRLSQDYGGNHVLGRFRLSVSPVAGPLLLLPPRDLAILSKPMGEWAPDELRKISSELLADDPAWKRLDQAVREHQGKAPKLPSSNTQARTLAERGSPRKTHVLVRGDFLRRGAEVQAGTPSALHPFEPQGKRPDRLDLSNWLLDARNPLTTRVTVNRWWQYLFGRGLVTTVDDFGVRGSAPSHPLLLDWLASELIRQGWSRKQLIELIVSSSTYRQASIVRPGFAARDPQNELLSRQNRFRVEAEIIRDLSLDASGLLSRKLGGPSIRPRLPSGVAELGYAGSVKWPQSKGEDNYRRGLYIFFQRTVPYPMLMTFDSADSTVTCLRRERSNTPLQALTLLNDPVFFECAQAFGARIVREGGKDSDDRLRYAFRLCLCREPGAEELKSLQALFRRLRKFCEANPEGAKKMLGKFSVDGISAGELASWVSLSRVLLNLDEFISRS